LALDTNVLVYAEGVNDPGRRLNAEMLVGRLPLSGTVIPVQVLGELFRVLTRKARWPAADARAAVLSWQDSFFVQPTTSAVLAAAMDLAADHGFASWDAVVVAAAAEAGCRLLLSEDMHEGFTWRGVTIINPFAPVPHPLLTATLGAAGSTGGDPQ
jgi:predicted nucleic acid-binding protein